MTTDTRQTMTKEEAFADLDAVTKEKDLPQWLLVERLWFVGGFRPSEARKIVQEWVETKL